MRKIACILAGGKGSRMESSSSKAMTLLNGKSLIDYSVDAVKDYVDDIVVVYSDYSLDLLENIKDVFFRKQISPLGAGDALKSAMDLISDYDQVIVLSCDMPLIKAVTIKAFLEDFDQKNYKCSHLTTILEDPRDYGRVVRHGSLIKIVEEADTDETNKDIKEVNVATYIYDVKSLNKYIDKLDTSNKKGEYLITDLIEHFSSNALLCGTYLESDYEQFIGVNSKKELNEAMEKLNK